jgi:hypothetical protein
MYDSGQAAYSAKSSIRRVIDHFQRYQFTKSTFICKGINWSSHRLFAKSSILRVKIGFVNFEFVGWGVDPKFVKREKIGHSEGARKVFG